MKNVLFIVLDSITNDQLFNSPMSKKKAPFLNNLRKKSVSGDKMYAEAPYTEAALMSLLGSLDTMDKGGYMQRFKNKTSVMTEFSQKGYKTFFVNYYPTIYPSYVHYDAEEYNYIENYDINQLWSYRFEYYQNLFLNKKTTDKENQMLLDMLEDNLKAWIEILTLFKNNDKKTILLNDCIDRANLTENIKIVQKELKLLQKNQYSYLQELMTMGKEHRLFKIKNYDYVDKVNDDEFRKWFHEQYERTFTEIKKIQRNHNLRNASFPYGKLFRNITNKNIVKGLLAGYKNLIFDKDIMNRINEHYDLFKHQRSFRTVANLTIDWLEKNKDGKKPWMCYVHIDDAHYTENFFSYDTNDKKIINEEFTKINEYIHNLPKDYCGTLSYDLALLYCDSIIKNIFEYLEKNNLLDNTSIVITADHGFSYYFYPVREKYVISSYKENYNVPFIIYDKDLKAKMINGYLATKDIPVTLLDLAGIKKPKEFKGESLLKFNGRDYATLEYMGGGCPDIKRRPIQLGIRNDNYEVFAEVLNDEVNVKEVYDMHKDKYENHNLVKDKNINIAKEVNMIQKRYEEIIKDLGD